MSTKYGIFQEQGIYSCESIKTNGADFEAVVFRKNGKRCLELRVSGTAIALELCNLKDKKIHQWLWETGIKFIEEIEEPTTVGICSEDIVGEKLNKDWKNLIVDENSYS